ncbi:hypothetical protein B0T18DRAFT_51737 [Schizothecium vesticola]|uniref:Uncharacterized protein n=1 Tax=Schizothecium vesticola TaxID=314040 RepID=A0AA40KDD8_9PEZI|nr:hypothetical protein B0T18DRAFT_51737 [Schizothecium vesticola]
MHKEVFLSFLFNGLRAVAGLGGSIYTVLPGMTRHGFAVCIRFSRGTVGVELQGWLRVPRPLIQNIMSLNSTP